jgi:hypothetical protein
MSMQHQEEEVEVITLSGKTIKRGRMSFTQFTDLVEEVLDQESLSKPVPFGWGKRKQGTDRLTPVIAPA